MKTLVESQRFIEAWNSAECVADVASSLGVTRSYASNRAHRLRNSGHFLKSMDQDGRVHVLCATCGAEFSSYRSASRSYCSRKCIPRDHARTHGGSTSRLYRIWCDMKARCHNQSSFAFEYYGARGIEVCQEWRSSFAVFRQWSRATGYKPSLEIDRIDPDGNYEPDNCRWATRTQQMSNCRKRRDAKTSRFKGVHLIRKSGRWRAQGTRRGKPIHLGCFGTEVQAAKAYDDWARQEYGEFARPNFGS